MEQFVFVSGNQKKVEYLERFLKRKVDHHELDLVEVQSLNPIEVVEHKVKEAFDRLGHAVLVEDTAVRFEALGRLPGPFIKYFLSEIGNEGLCKMLDDLDNRNAVASVIYGFYDGKALHIFDAEVKGLIAPKPVGSKGMGWDPIFIPDGQQKTYAEMNESEYAKYSVRNKAVQKLKSFLSNSGDS